MTPKSRGNKALPSQETEVVASTTTPSRPPASLSGELPASYGETRVVLMPVDPHRVHIYWDVGPQDLQKMRFGQNLVKTRCFSSFLRFHPAVPAEVDQAFFDIPVVLGARSWYVSLGSPKRSYFADLGLKTDDGDFVFLARSNTIELPQDKPSPPPAHSPAVAAEQVSPPRTFPVHHLAGPQFAGPPGHGNGTYQHSPVSPEYGFGEEKPFFPHREAPQPPAPFLREQPPFPAAGGEGLFPAAAPDVPEKIFHLHAAHPSITNPGTTTGSHAFTVPRVSARGRSVDLTELSEQIFTAGASSALLAARK